MNHVRSADGTPIAYDCTGNGPPVVLLAGAFNDRATTAPLGAELARQFTVFNVDRRGRGDSGDAGGSTPEREIEDLAAVIEAAGGTAAVFGYSSGAILALRAAAAGAPIARLALYEPPVVVDDRRPRPPADLAQRLRDLIREDRRGDAVELYQSAGIGLSAEIVAQIRHAPFRPGLEAIAHTLVYDAELTGDLSLPTDAAAAIRIPVLVIRGGKSWPFLRDGAAALAEALPAGRLTTLEDESHDLNPAPTAEALADFLS